MRAGDYDPCVRSETRQPSDASTTAVGWAGPVVVACMFAFGLLVVGGFWTYWALYDRPLQPLREAIAAEHPDLFVQIAAGTAKKSHVEELRIVARVPFDPQDNVTRSQELADSIRSIALAWPDTMTYDRLEVIFYETLGESREEYWSEVTELGDARRMIGGR